MLKTTKILTMMLVLLMGMSFASCDEFLSSNDNPVSPNLKVQTTSLTVQVGKTAKCKATASSKARLTFFSSDESIATVSTSGVVKGISVGTTYVTALATNPAGSDVFLEESAIITVNVVEKDKEPEEPEEPGTMTVTAEGYTGTYDGEAHGIKVTAPEGATVKYGEAEGTYDLDTNPTYKNAGTYTVYYQVTKASYDTVSGSATVTINKADMTVTAEGYSGVYDGSAHGITVNAPTGAIVKYGTSAGSYDKTSSPTYTNANTYTVYYEVTKDNYTTVTGSADVKITKAAGEIKFTQTSIEKNYGDVAFINDTFSIIGDGVVTYTSSDTSVASVSNVSPNNGLVSILGAGIATITATVTDSENYTYAVKTAEYTIVVKPQIDGRDPFDAGTDPFN